MINHKFVVVISMLLNLNSTIPDDIAKMKSYVNGLGDDSNAVRRSGSKNVENLVQVQSFLVVP